MPAKSPAQFRLMIGIAHGMKPNHPSAPSEAVAKEMVMKTSASDRKKFIKHGSKTKKH